MQIGMLFCAGNGGIHKVGRKDIDHTRDAASPTFVQCVVIVLFRVRGVWSLVFRSIPRDA